MASQDATIGFTRPEMGKKKPAGSSEPPTVRHAFCIVKTSADDWPEKFASPILEKLQDQVDKNKVRVTACEAIEGDEDGDVIIFPDFVRLPGALRSDIDALRLDSDIQNLADRLMSDVPFALAEDCILIKRAQIMVAHTKRDSRCGFCGSKLVEEFESVMKANGKTGAVEVRKCSHIGGHDYAGNVLVFRPTAAAPAQDPNCGGDWFGYVTPAHVPLFLEFAEAEPTSYPPHSVHHLWRGRFGVSGKAHVELCENVNAACSGCTDSVRDMEDGVAGWPSPTVRDEKTKKLFLSPKAPAKPEQAEQPKSAALPVTVQTPSKAARVVFILGAPGSGKGTMCSNLVRDYDMIHLSAGDLLREERQNPASSDGQLIETYIKEGKIVPVAITVKLLWNAMQRNMLEGRFNFLIDGFPRNKDNLDGWNEQLGPEKARVVGVIFLDCTEAIAEERVLERGKTSGRADDNIVSIRKRFSTYVNETMPIVSVFDREKMCWKVDSTRPVEEVYVDVRKVVDEFVLPKRRRVLFVLGGPGSGKGTQCSNLVRDFDCTHLSAGDLLRAERQNPNSKDGKLIESYIIEGKIVPVEITVNLLLRAMETSSARNFLIDGFPRNLDNVQGWNKVVGEQSSTYGVAGVLFFDVPEDVMEARLLDRAKKDGANARSDDNIEVIKKRFKTFQAETMPVVDIYRKKNMVWTIGANRPIGEVYEQVKAIAQEVFLPAIEFQPRPKVQQQATKVSSFVPESRKMAHTEATADNTLQIVVGVTVLAAVTGLLGLYFFRGSSRD